MDPIEALRIRGIGVGKKLVGDAQAADVRAGKTFSNAQSNSNTGTSPVRSLVAQTVTPGVNNITKQAGIYDGDITIEGDLNLVASNIISGKTIFGVAGGFTGRRWASGTATSDANGYLRVTGIAFAPSIVIASMIGTSNPSQHMNTVIATKTADFLEYDGSYIFSIVTYFGNTYGAAISANTTNMLTADGFNFNQAQFFSNKQFKWYAFE